MNRCFTHIHMQRLCQILVQYWLHWLSSVVLSLHCVHNQNSCIMLVYFGFNKLCQNSYSDSHDLPGISWHLSLLPVEPFLFLKKLEGHFPVFQRRSSCGPGCPPCSNRDTLGLYTFKTIN